MISPLIQAWFAITNSETSPFRLYALSNTGSILALISYPFGLETYLGMEAQTRFWSILFFGNSALLVLCSLVLLRSETEKLSSATENSIENNSSDPSFARCLLWVGLAASASALLLAVTNYVCHDIAVIPFLWIIPLLLYLLSFILCFDSDRWYDRRIFIPLTLVLLAVMNSGYISGVTSHITEIATVAFATLFCACMLAHGELVKCKPSAFYLTKFYLMISLGGALGGVFVAILAPYFFNNYLELPISFLVLGLLVAFVLLSDNDLKFYTARIRRAYLAVVGGCLIGFIIILIGEHSRSDSIIYQSRNFYGILRISAENLGDPENYRRSMRHGRVLHGMQFLADDRRREPTAYFTRDTGSGMALERVLTGGPKNIGVVGLGVGTLATYGRKGDTIKFYEINPDVIYAAEEFFTYLKDSPADISTLLGDGRLSLARQDNQNFHAIFLDAFSSDAIPIHLITQEAVEIYLRHLVPGGMIVLNLTNRHVDLSDVVLKLAQVNDLVAVEIASRQNLENATFDTRYIILSRDRPLLEEFTLNGGRIANLDNNSQELWTDDFSNLFETLKWFD
ncbi:hypothetical protein BVY02_00460 [bacterium J17]|nr:hypothetical protein BVY02_00460 [bacterium J17]